MLHAKNRMYITLIPTPCSLHNARSRYADFRYMLDELTSRGRVVYLYIRFNLGGGRIIYLQLIYAYCPGSRGS